MLASTREVLVCNTSVASVTVLTRANHAARDIAPAWDRSGVEPPVTRVSGGAVGDVTVLSDIARSEPISTAVLTRAECSYSAARDVDPHLIAAVLARVDGVDAVYVSKSPGVTHVWTVLLDYGDAVLDAVFARELELHDYFGHWLAPVEFHVLEYEAAHALDIGDRVFERVRQ